MCCGQRLTKPSGAFRPTREAVSRFATPVRVGLPIPLFEHLGTGNLVVRGPLSGKQYRFAGRGAAVAVDPRDRVALTFVTQIRELKK